jgi:hypothetical protein
LKKSERLSYVKQIQTYSKKNKFTKLFINSFSESKTKDLAIRPQSKKLLKGKIIRNINIVTLDPFGYSELDTTKKPQNELW